MDNHNLKPAVMGDKFLQSLSVKSRVIDSMEYAAQTADTQATEMDWDGKVNMPVLGGHNDAAETSVNGSNNLHLKAQKVTRFVIPVPVSDTSDMNEPFEFDIDKKQASKKVVLPETKNDNLDPQDTALFGFRCKKRPLKRDMKVAENPLNTSYTLDAVTLKVTNDLLEKVKCNQVTGQRACIIYNKQKFSGVDNLVRDKHPIGCGAFGEVWKVRDSQTGEELVQKVVKKNEKGIISVEYNEILVPLQFWDVENIAKVYGLDWSGDKLSYIMEDAGMSLRRLIDDECYYSLGPDKIESILLDIFTAVYHLSKHGVKHCDIKPENICLKYSSNQLIAKLVDFGSSKTLKDLMTYAGVTPEYLDLHVNKFLYERTYLRNHNYEVHVLDEKDDVYAVGLVGLSLLMKAHPMILHFTGSTDYSKDPVRANDERKSVIKKISEMNEKDLMDLLNMDMSFVMKELLPRVLCLDRDKRWTANEAVLFLQSKLKNVQPPNKLFKQESQLHDSMTQDVFKFMNLHERGTSFATKNKIKQPHEASPVLNQNHDARQMLGIAIKEPPKQTAPPGMILFPAKFKGYPSQGQDTSAFATVQLKGANPRQEGDNQLLMRRGFQSKVVPEDQESREYKELVESFGPNTRPSMSQNNLPAQQNHFANLVNHATRMIPIVENANGAQQMIQNMDTGPNHPGSFQTGNPGLNQKVHQQSMGINDDTVAIQGIFGTTFNLREKSRSGYPFELSGNIPNISAIIPTEQEQSRRKIKGVRRSRTSQD